MLKRQLHHRSNAGAHKHPRWRRTLALLCFVLAVLPALVTAQAPAPPGKAYNRPVLIHVEGPIGPLLHAYVERKLDEAKSKNADLVILEIESPGGTAHHSFLIANQLKDLDWAHTVAYVPDYAISGAAIISLGCDDILMAPTARIGDAGVIVQGEDGLFRHAEAKISSDLARQVRDLAEATGRPPAIAEAMVDKDLEVFRVTSSKSAGDRYLSQADIDASPDPKSITKHELLQPSRKGVYLELNGKQAVKTTLAQGLALEHGDLKLRYGYEQPLTVLTYGWTDTWIYILNTTFVSFLLIAVGLIALYVECSAPGVGVGGLIAGLCFALFFWSHFLGGTAGWLEVVLFLAGAIFIAMEIFVIPGFGIAGISGICLMGAGVFLASQHFVLPTAASDFNVVGTNLMMLLAVGVTLVTGAFIVTKYYGSLPVLGAMVLKPPVYDDATTDEHADPAAVDDEKKARAAPGEPVQVGDWGVAESPLRPAGKVVINGEFVDVVTDGSYVDKGSQVKVIKITGNMITVREIPPESDA